jgi:hypothetical protein
MNFPLSRDVRNVFLSYTLWLKKNLKSALSFLYMLYFENVAEFK